MVLIHLIWTSFGLINVVLDTDIGTDFDDAMALHYLLARSKPNDPDAIFSLRLIQVSTFNTTKRAQIVAFILDSLGRFDVPIGVGTYTGEQHMSEYPIAEDYSLDTFMRKGGKLSYNITAFETELRLSTATNPIFIVEIAPATSLGEILALNNTIGVNSVVVAMSGSVHRGYLNSSTPSREYNVITDIPASQAMYQAAWLAPLCMVPLDSTVFDQFYGPTYAALLEANTTTGHPYAVSLLEHYVVWYNNGGKNFFAMLPFSPNSATSTMYDLQAAWSTQYYAQAIMSKPVSLPLLVLEMDNIGVDVNGFTVICPSCQPVVVQENWAGNIRNTVEQFGAELISYIIAA